MFALNKNINFINYGFHLHKILIKMIFLSDNYKILLVC